MRPHRICAGLAVAAFALAACSQEPATDRCPGEAPSCLIQEAGFETNAAGERVFIVRVANACLRSIDVKVCLQRTDAGEADCLERTLDDSGRMSHAIPSELFSGNSQLYVRFTDDARICRFPLTKDVRFE